MMCVPRCCAAGHSGATAQIWRNCPGELKDVKSGIEELESHQGNPIRILVQP
ncbi:hypothetical protein [Cutibacterium sp.]|uniref:hypothetical protein n=1 Tax=Cutibacterium sp. TaxID=1912221 RepID=UPI0026DB7A2B|nr:hypothetical protein [Cutibacterium sp.]MDO4412271.1 hypothetical protein [Cutibacterium sp.]